MSAGYLGPFASIGGGAFGGWSNFSVAAGSHHSRYSDGDPVSAAVWRELYGDLNYLLAQSARPVWQDSFVVDGATPRDPTYSNAGASWTAASIYAIVPGVIWTPNLRRGPHAPPGLSITVRFRATAGAGAATAFVRVYVTRESVRSIRDSGLPSEADAGYVEFSQTALTYSDSGGTGFTAAQVLVPGERNAYETQVEHPGYDAGDPSFVMTALASTLILCGRGAGAPYIAAVSVVEEAPAA